MDASVAPRPSRKPLVAVAALALAAIVAFALLVEFHFPGPDAAKAVDYVGDAITALVAAACCFYATTRTEGRIRLAWALLGMSAAAWGAGEVVRSVYEVGLGQAGPYPGWPDLGFLASIPFAFAGIRAFWREGRGTPSRWRVWLDALIISLALTFTAWVLGLRLVWDNGDRGLARLVDLAYPIGDILIGTVLILAIRRATRRRKGRVLVLLAGVGCLAVTESAFAYLAAAGAHDIHGSALDAGWFAGYLLIALAAAWPRTAVTAAVDDAPVDLWQLALPWLTVAGAGASAAFVAVSGLTLDLFLTALTGVGACLLTINMILTNRDFLAMLLKSRASEATLADIIKQAPVGIARADRQLKVVGANPALGRLLERSPDSMLGLTFERYVPAEAQPDLLEKFARVSRGEVETEGGELPLIRADESRIWARWTMTAVKSTLGQTDYFLTTLEDVDARHQAEQAAKASLETLERLNALKTQFLQSVSHEFKTALIGIQGFSEFMRDADQLDLNDARTFAADIHRDAERLDRMVTEMIALDRVESTRANMRLEPVDVNAVVAEEVAGAQPTMSAAIVTELARALPPVAGDAEKLGLAVRTLLSSAAKYSPEGGRITVTTALTGDVVTVSVRDQGVAVRADFDNRLFGRDDLYADNPIRKVVGTGLGLGIVRQVVEMHGGRLWVDAVEGGGSDFHFTLPVVAAAQEPVPATTGGMVA